MSSIKIIFQDGDLLVLDKSAGLVVDKSNTQQKETLEEILQTQFQINLSRGGIVHRLDKDTSGIILVAKTQAALENLQAQFKDRETQKEYLALVHGIVEKAGVVEGAIGRNPVNREKFTVLESGKEAVTEYEPVEKFKVRFSQENLRKQTSSKFKVWFEDFNKIQMRKLERQHYGVFTLLRCFPKTGRTHQIRVHLKYINHPIVSDEKYAGRKISRLDKRWCPRIFLHAAKIGFNHPVSGKWMELESPLPEDLKEVLSLLNNKRYVMDDLAK